MHIRMLRSFTVDTGEGTTKTYPAGWVGEADDDHAELAISGEAAALSGFAQQAEPDPVDEHEAHLHKLSRAELDALAVEKGIDPASAPNKGELVKLLLAAA